MSQHQVDTQAIVVDEKADGTKATRRLLADLVVGVRVDALPASEAERLASAGKFYPLTTDANGNLRVVTPDWIKVETNELAVLRESRDLLLEIRDLLMQIA